MARSRFDPSENVRRSYIEQQPTAQLPAVGRPLEDQPTLMLPAVGGNRRTFLKAAVIASASVATAGGATGAALFTGKLPTIPFVGSVVSGASYHGCITGSNYQVYSIFTVNSKGMNSTPGTFLLWFTNHALPSGSYDLTVQIKTYAVNSNSTVLATSNLGDTGAHFIFKAGGNNAFAFKVANAHNCPTSAPPGQLCQAHTLNAMMPVNWPQPAGGTYDLQVYAHIDWWGHTVSSHAGDTQRFDFIIAFKNHGTGKMLGSETLTITAKQA